MAAFESYLAACGVIFVVSTIGSAYWASRPRP